ncbi:hypothetical protein HUB94_15205 [Paenibacillus cellulosilyticus]|nr:hypothetical protein [Paenibacillus cellulosilyticus]QKS45632.1 hypothetical protein HUB94_15205 [Paenibacillus cellulosilyticus]
MKVELPVHDTIINTFNIYGSITSIISNKEQCWPWMYNNFIQIRYVYDWNVYFFDHHHLLIDNCPWLDHHVIPKYFIESKWNSIVELIIDSLNSGNYLYLFVDRYHISAAKEFYKKSPCIHEIFIYGYNIETRELLVADNLQNGKYIQTVCTFEEIELGYNAVDTDNNFYLDVHLLSLKEENKYNINISQIAQSLNNYLDSTCSMDVSFKERTLFGQKAILFSVENVADQKIDIRAFHLFWEHKHLMFSRINYLIQHNVLSEGQCLLDSYRSIRDKFESLRNLALKYNITKENKLLTKIHSHIVEGLSEEKQILMEVKDRLYL